MCLIQGPDPEVDPERAHFRGPLKAAITIIEFGDLECPLTAAQRWFLAYSSPSRSPNPHHLAVLTRPGFDRAAPTRPGTSRIRLPPATPTCCDRTAAKVSHLHSNHQRLTAHVDRGLDGDEDLAAGVLHLEVPDRATASASG